MNNWQNCQKHNDKDRESSHVKFNWMFAGQLYCVVAIASINLLINNTATHYSERIPVGAITPMSVLRTIQNFLLPWQFNVKFGHEFESC